MLTHLLPSVPSICRQPRALAYLSVLGVSLSGALTTVQADPVPTPMPLESRSPGSESPSAQDPQAPLADLNEVLEATRTKLEELNEAAGIVASSSTKLLEVQALEADNRRLTIQLTQALARESKLAARLAQRQASPTRLLRPAMP